MSEESKAIKVAVLGGGMAAMTAAFELTDPSLNGKYEVTVYQLGWRLGGKGASGRDMQNHDRIQEHGLHIWLGCYENSFHLMNECYAELGRSPNDPLGTVESAFKPHSLVALQELFNGRWLPWEFNFPSTRKFPGNRNTLPSMWDYLLRVLEWIPELLHPHIDTHLNDEANPVDWPKPDWWDDVIGELEPGTHFVGREPLYGTIKLAHSLDTATEKNAPTHEKMHFLLNHFRTMVHNHILDSIKSNRDLYHLWILLDLAISNMMGILADHLLYEPLDRINKYDYRDWLGLHGADQLTLDSAPVTVFYELVFAYENGVTQGADVRRNLEAGTLLHGLPRIALGYTGAFMWLMQAGMGDTVFAPLYQVLQRRGVRFEFFSRVTNLNVENDELVGIEISRQVNLKVGQYNPLILVKGLPCWPSEPLYDQIAEGNILRRDQINLESFWTPWKDTGGTIHLKAGVDFDQVVLGISLAALPFICQPWINENPKWQAMISQIQTVQTQAIQLWLSPSLKDLGCPLPKSINGTFTITPLDTWADMSHLISSENWRPGQVSTIAYFTGPMAGPAQPPPASERDFEKQAEDQAWKTVRDLVGGQLKDLWPDFDWQALIAPPSAQGPDRLNFQYVRANDDPTERYVQTVRNSTQYRLRADQSGIKRLYLAGDWTENGLNLGCIEAATTSGMQASQAISGFPTIIVGDKQHTW